MTVAEFNSLADSVLDAAFELHRKLGPGLSENVYETVLSCDLITKGHYVERQKYFSFKYKGMWFANAFRVDMLIDDVLILELKSAKAFGPGDEKQLLTYLRLGNKRLGYLINFGAPLLKMGIKRIANGLQ